MHGPAAYVSPEASEVRVEGWRGRGIGEMKERKIEKGPLLRSSKE
jgi:hypothetical protein